MFSHAPGIKGGRIEARIVHSLSSLQYGGLEGMTSASVKCQAYGLQ